MTVDYKADVGAAHLQTVTLYLEGTGGRDAGAFAIESTTAVYSTNSRKVTTKLLRY